MKPKSYPFLSAAAVAALAAAVAWAPQAVHAQSTAPSYTAAQEDTGAGLYRDNCEMCHGASLDDGQFAPPLKGASFKGQWGGRSAAELFEYVATNMPPGQAGALGSDGYAAVMAHILKANGVPAGDKALPGDTAALKAMQIPK